MKILAVVAAAACVLTAGALQTAAQSTPRSHVAYSVHVLELPSVSTRFHGHLTMRRVLLPLQTSGTATPAPTTQPTTAPTATATSAPQYPDPVGILQNMFTVANALKTAHFQEIYLQAGTANFTITAVGDATCSGPSVQATVKGKATLTGTSQKSSANLKVIQVKNKFYIKSKSTKNVWAKSTSAKSAVFGFNAMNPLPCPTAATSTGSGSGSTGSSDQIKDLQNLGPITYHGATVWHIHAIDVAIDPSGATAEFPLDWYVDQTNSLPVGYTFSFNDTANNAAGSLETILTNFGKKVKIKAPKIGSATP